MAKTARMVETVGHMAIVDAVSSLHIALSSLESQWTKLQVAAAQKQIGIPHQAMPNVDVNTIFTCRARSLPKYAPALKYLVGKEKEIGLDVENVTILANNLQFVTQLVTNDQIEHETLEAMSIKLNKFFSDYTSFLSGLEAVTCVDDAQMLNQLAFEQCPNGECREKKAMGLCPEGSCT